MVEYKLGFFAESLCGHDKGRIYMIVGREGDRVGLCDGSRRLIDNPKYKKTKHIQMIRSEETAAQFRQLPDGAAKNSWIYEKVCELNLNRKRKQEVNTCPNQM